jgi:hypothetical protein
MSSSTLSVVASKPLAARMIALGLGILIVVVILPL